MSIPKVNKMRIKNKGELRQRARRANMALIYKAPLLLARLTVNGYIKTHDGHCLIRDNVSLIIPHTFVYGVTRNYRTPTREIVLGLA